MERCPHPDLLCRVNDPTLSASIRAGLEYHIDECDTCRAKFRRSNSDDVTPGELCVTHIAPNIEQNRYVARSPSPPPWLEGLIPSHFDLVRELGSGGMGVVFLVRDTRSDKQVALKFYGPKDSTQHTQSAMQRFAREAEIALSLDHPNIVRGLETGESEGIGYIVTEYVFGMSLREHVKEQGEIPWQQATQLVIQAARGLAYAHESGYIHRDVKPDNLMLDVSGNVKLLDMGLAKCYRPKDDTPAEERANLTENGILLGTPQVMSPEQAQANNDELNPATDVYSLGCVYHELVTGVGIFAKRTLRDELLSAHVFEPAPQIARHCPEFPPELEAIFQTMVAKESSQRYQNASELVAALEGALSEIERQQQRSQRFRLTGVGLLFGLVLAAVIFLVTRGSSETHVTPDPAATNGNPDVSVPDTSDSSIAVADAPAADDVAIADGAEPPVVAPIPRVHVAPVVVDLPEIVNSIQMRFVKIPGDGQEIEPFYLAVYETTIANAQLRANPPRPADGKELSGLLPQADVTLTEAIDFCDRLSSLPAEKQTRRSYRLPTIREWIHASKAGTETRYSWGDDYTQIGKYAWWSENSGDRAHPVGEKFPNPWGLYDMQGNVGEWTSKKEESIRNGYAGGHWYAGDITDFTAEQYSTLDHSRPRPTIGFRLVCEQR